MYICIKDLKNKYVHAKIKTKEGDKKPDEEGGERERERVPTIL